MDKLILVDYNNQEIGSEEKMYVHQKGLLHRAFSIFIFNKNHELLIQQRAHIKYHSGGKWTNTCCSHPLLGENQQEAVEQRLWYEMGVYCHLDWLFDLYYYSVLDNNMIEHEYDQIYIGYCDKEPLINHKEVSAYAWKNITSLKNDIAKYPDDYTYWFKVILLQIESYMKTFR